MTLSQKSGLEQNGHHQLADFQIQFERLVENVTNVVVASEQTIRLALLGLFAGGHVLLEDLPGVGKTLLAKTIASSIDGEFSRIQFTPDLLPSDITGASILDMQRQTLHELSGLSRCTRAASRAASEAREDG